MTKEKEIGIGDEVETKVARYGKEIKINGIVKEVKTSYGRKEYLLINTRTSDFWARSVNLVIKHHG